MRKEFEINESLPEGETQRNHFFHGPFLDSYIIDNPIALQIIEAMPDVFSMIGFEIGDIVRSGLVRNYIIAKMNLAL